LALRREANYETDMVAVLQPPHTVRCRALSAALLTVCWAGFGLKLCKGVMRLRYWHDWTMEEKFCGTLPFLHMEENVAQSGFSASSIQAIAAMPSASLCDW